MSNIFNNVRIIPRDGGFLQRITGNSGDVYFNKNLNSLRIYNGDDTGGFEILTEGNSAPILGKAEIAGVVHVVTVARNTADDANVFYIDGIETPSLTFVKGFVYVFDQTDSSNADFGGGQPHPLYISTDSLGASRTDTNVTYLLDSIPVSFTKYVADFERSTVRQVIINVKNTTPELLYYNCNFHSGMGAGITTGLPGAGSGSASVTASDTAPEEPENGAVWFNTLTAKLYVYIDDGDSSQWVQPASPVISDISQLTDDSNIIPTDLTDLGISDGTVNQVLTTDGAGNFTFQDAAGGGGSFDQDLNTTDDVEFASVSAASFTNTGIGLPVIESASTLTLTAADGVIVTGSPFRLPSFDDAGRDALTASNGDMIYNTDNNRIEAYVNGAWVSVNTSAI